MRNDRFLYADVGVRKNILNLLLCYNPSYLKLALEIMYSQVLMITGDTEACLSRFLEEVYFVDIYLWNKLYYFSLFFDYFVSFQSVCSLMLVLQKNIQASKKE